MSLLASGWVELDGGEGLKYLVSGWLKVKVHCFPFEVGDRVKTIINGKVRAAVVDCIEVRMRIRLESGAYAGFNPVYLLTLRWKDDGMEVHKEIESMVKRGSLVIWIFRAVTGCETEARIIYEGAVFKQHAELEVWPECVEATAAQC